MNFYIRPKKSKWVVTQGGANVVESFHRRRDAIERVKSMATALDVIYVQNACGIVTVRVPEKLMPR
jgi:hypothetical protein